MERKESIYGLITDIRTVSIDDLSIFISASRSMRGERYFSLERLASEGDTVIDDSGVIKVEPGKEVIVIRGSLDQIAGFDHAVEEIRGEQHTGDSQE